MKRRILLGAGLALPALAARAQDIPGRSITLVVPFGAGTVVDIMARAFAEPFRQAMGGNVSVVVLNREGAGGAIGTGFVAQARPDGAILGFGPSGMMTTQPILVPSLPYRLESIEPLCQTFENIFVLAVPAQSPHRTLAAFLDAARAQPERLSFGHAGNGTVGHLIMRQIELLANLRLSDVAYRAGGQMMVDVQAGTIDMALTTWATVRDSGLRVLAIAADTRDPAIDAPTLIEAGFPVTWRGFGGIYAPRGLPPALAQRIEAACLEATRSEAYGNVMRSTAQVVAPLDARDFARRLAAEQAEARSMLDRLGLIPR